MFHGEDASQHVFDVSHRAAEKGAPRRSTGSVRILYYAQVLSPRESAVLMPQLSIITTRRVAFVLACALIVALGAQRTRRRGPTGNPNIVLIVLDAVRADRLGCYGYGRPTSPNIDRLAREGVIFDRAIAQGGWTKPSIASLFTSLYPHTHGASGAQSPLPPEVLTLAEKLHELRYFTTAVQTNPFLSGGRNFGQGFDTYTEMIGAEGTRLVAELGKQLETRKPERFFAYLHFLDAHTPYKPPERHRAKFVRPYEGTLDKLRVRSRVGVYEKLGQLSEADKRHISDLYDASVSAVDEYVGQIVDKLAELDYIDNTLFILTADHGEELFDRGGFEHGHSMYEEVVRVPLIMHHPRLAAGGVKVKQLVRLVDVFPTVMGFLGRGSPKGLMGRDLGPAIANPKADWRMVGLTERALHGPQQWAVQQGPFKIIYIARATEPWEVEFLKLFPAHPGSTSVERIEMYDLGRDPFERTPLSDLPLQKHMLDVLDLERLAGPGVTYAATPEKIDPKRLEQLRSLGYVGR